MDRVGSAKGTDVVDHVADDLNAGLAIAAAVPEDAGIAGGAGQVMHAGADHLAVIAVRGDPLGAVPGDIEVDDLDVVPVIPDGGAVGARDLRPPFRVRDVGDGGGGRPALGHFITGVAPGVVARREVGVVARAHELGDARHGVARGGGGAGIRIRARRRDIVVGASAQGVERRRGAPESHRDRAAAGLSPARRRDRRRADHEPSHQAARGNGRDRAVARRPRHGAAGGQAIRVLEDGRELRGRRDLHARRRLAYGHGGDRRGRGRSPGCDAGVADRFTPHRGVDTKVVQHAHGGLLGPEGEGTPHQLFRRAGRRHVGRVAV